MALIECISCGARISDKAIACPKCGATDQSELSAAKTEEIRIEKERKAAEKLRIKEEPKDPKEDGKVIRAWQSFFWLLMLFVTLIAILGSLPESTWVECGEKYWDYDRERYVRKKC